MENELEKARKYMLKILKIKDFSEKELFEKLADKGYSRETAEETLEYLKNHGFIDDKTYAARLVKKYSEDRPSGTYLIKRKLKEKGINQDDSEQYIKNVDELSTARKYILKKLHKIKGKTEEEAKKFIYRNLMSRGFSYDSVEKILNEYAGGNLIEQQ
jgi:regulatory protein